MVGKPAFLCLNRDEFFKASAQKHQDGKAFEKVMSALLIQYMAELIASQEDEARRIVETRGE